MPTLYPFDAANLYHCCMPLGEGGGGRHTEAHLPNPPSHLPPLEAVLAGEVAIKAE